MTRPDVERESRDDEQKPYGRRCPPFASNSWYLRRPGYPLRPRADSTVRKDMIDLIRDLGAA